MGVNFYRPISGLLFIALVYNILCYRQTDNRSDNYNNQHKSQNLSRMSRKYPKAVVFDLDYTLWPCWCDVHIALPVRSGKNNAEIIDSYGYRMSLYPDVPDILKELKANDVTIISASRTPTVHIAKQLLKNIKIDGKPMHKYFDNHQWGTGSKTRHIRQAAKELGMELDLQNGEFILYDDEYRNKDVNSIGCKFVYIRDTDLGLTKEIFDSGIDQFN